MYMRTIIIITSFIISLPLLGQNKIFTPNTCDSNVLSTVAHRKCLEDSLFSNDLITRIDYISFLKTNLLPKYRAKRNEIKLPSNLLSQLKTLKAIYDSTLDHKTRIWSLEGDKNQMHIQPKSYVVTKLSFEPFFIYPDIYAILFNPIQLSLKPQNDYRKTIASIELAGKILSEIPDDLEEKLEVICKSMMQERKKYTRGYFYDIFQGAIDEDKRLAYNVINFLLWTE